MANNRNQPQDEDYSLEAFRLLSNQDRSVRDEEERKKDRLLDLKMVDTQIKQNDVMIKTLELIYLPVSNTNKNLIEFNKSQLEINNKILAEMEKTNLAMQESASNTKKLFDFFEKKFERENSKPVKPKESSSNNNDRDGNGRPDNFDDKARHEAGILGHIADLGPTLTSIKSDTAEIVKLLKAQNNKPEPPPRPKDDGWKMPSMPKLLPFLIPAIAAAMAMRNEEVGNAAKAGLGVATAGARVAAPILEAAKAGASSAAAGSRIAAAAAAARGAANLSTVRQALTGPAKVGVVGKIGAGLGAGATIGRAMEGDYAGATAQGISTLLPLILAKTKYGKMAGLAAAGIDVGLLGRDYIKFKGAEAEAAARGETLKSPLQNFKDDVSKVGAFFGIGDGPKAEEALDPVVQNTAETNKILQDIRDGKVSTAPGISSNSVMTAALMAGGTAMLMRGGLGRGIASTGLGQRIASGVGGLASSARGAAGAAAGVAGTVGKKALGKLIPGVGLYMGATGAYDKIKEGDWTGAALEGGSGIASLFPGIGTAVAIGLQGISATRDALKVTNAEMANGVKATQGELTKSVAATAAATNETLVSSTANANDQMIKNNASVSASILANSDLTNKNLEQSNKLANGSITASAQQLNNTSSTLSTTLMSASNTLLGMIAKFSIPGMAFQAGKSVYDFVAGNGPTANENAQSYGKEMNKNRAGNQMMVYKSFLNAGMSPQQAKIFTAEIGRENAYSPTELFGSHIDPKNGLTNVGMMSWQKDRAQKLMKFMAANGQLDEKGNIKWGQASLDAQARFIKEELGGAYYNKAGSKFLNDRNISYAEGAKLLGKNYIGWRYDDPKYASGHERRDRYYATLNEQLRNGTPIQPHAPVDPKAKDKKYISKEAFKKLSTAAVKPATPLGPAAMKKWEESEKVRVAELQKVQKGILAGTTVVGTAPTTPKTTAAKTTSAVTTGKQKDSEGQATAKSNKDYYNLGLKSVDVQKGVDMSGLQPQVKEAFFTMVGELFATKNPKSKIIVTSAFRSPQSQKALWDKKLKEFGGDESKTRKYVAPPGTSNHEKGIALDIDNKSTKGADILESSGLLAKYNFSRPMSHEPWHIEYGTGKTSAAAVGTSAAALGGALGDLAGDFSFDNSKAAWEATKGLAATGLSAILTSDAMDGIREFIQGGKIDTIQDSNPRAIAAGTFTKDESDPTRAMHKDIGNGDMWENLDQQLGDGTLKRQERDQKEYDKVIKAWGGKSGIFRQIGGKYGWLSEMFSGLFGEDNLLSNVFGVLTGSQDIRGIPQLVSKAVIGKNATLDGMGVIGGGFGGGLAENNQGAYPLFDQNAVGGYSQLEQTRAELSRAGEEQSVDARPQITDGGINAAGDFSADIDEAGFGHRLIGLSGNGLEGMGAVNGGFGGALYYDDTLNRYEDHEFQQAKYIQEQEQQRKFQVEMAIPEATQTPTAQAPGGGKSSQPGLDGPMFTRNPDSTIQQIAFAHLSSSV